MKKTTAIATAAAALTLTGAVLPAQASAAKVKFGSALDSTVAPVGALPAFPCDWGDPSVKCTFVQNESYGRPGGTEAPVTGTLKKVRVIAAAPGSFTLQMVRTKSIGGVLQTKVKSVGPTFHYNGQTPDNWSSGVFLRESFPVNMPIKRGWRLAMKSTNNPVRRCSGGGPNTLIHYPGLQLGWGFTPAAGTDGCYTLIEGVIQY